MKLGTGELTLADLRSFDRAEPHVSLDPGQRAAMAKTRRIVEERIAQGRPTYGINTGFGTLSSHMIGAEVTELIQGYVVGKTLETTEAELLQTVFAHPTLSEMMHESVLAAFGRAIHI